VDFDPVWVSTIQHIEAYGAIVSHESWVGDFIEWPRVPEGFPQRATGSNGGPLVPLMMFATGRLHVTFEAMVFHAQKEAAPSFYGVTPNDLNLRTDFEFRIRWSQVVSIESYEAPHYEDFMGNVVVPWARVRTEQPGELCDFLLSAGGRAPLFMTSVKERAEELCAMLQRRLGMIREADARKGG
jgi:hypothetical protein